MENLEERELGDRRYFIALCKSLFAKTKNPVWKTWEDILVSRKEPTAEQIKQGFAAIDELSNVDLHPRELSMMNAFESYLENPLSLREKIVPYKRIFSE